MRIVVQKSMPSLLHARRLANAPAGLEDVTGGREPVVSGF